MGGAHSLTFPYSHAWQILKWKETRGKGSGKSSRPSMGNGWNAAMGIVHVHLVGWKLVSLVEMQQALCDAAGAEKVPKH